jgi:hypothetical protein
VAGTEAGRAGTAKPEIEALEYLQSIYRNPMESTSVRIRAAVECLPYETPKLTAIAVGTLNAHDFYSRLERAILRSERARLIDGRVIEVEDHE